MRVKWRSGAFAGAPAIDPAERATRSARMAALNLPPLRHESKASDRHSQHSQQHY
jgi:hypothetical protein